MSGTGRVGVLCPCERGNFQTQHDFTLYGAFIGPPLRTASTPRARPTCPSYSRVMRQAVGARRQGGGQGLRSLGPESRAGVSSLLLPCLLATRPPAARPSVYLPRGACQPVQFVRAGQPGPEPRS